MFHRVVGNEYVWISQCNYRDGPVYNVKVGPGLNYRGLLLYIKLCGKILCPQRQYCRLWFRLPGGDYLR